MNFGKNMSYFCIFTLEFGEKRIPLHSLNAVWCIDAIITNFAYYGKTVQAQFDVNVQAGFG